MKMSRDIGPVHFVGIGGIGMSGIAEVLVNLGYTRAGLRPGGERQRPAPARQGRRRSQSATTPPISARRSVVVVSSAVKRDNPELKAARERLLPVVRRAEMLAELMRLKQAVAIAGTHGKTTTTSMVAALLDAGGFDPTVINGGIINAYGTNARMGASDWMVVEADESDGTFVKLPVDVALVTNIDPEHLDHYGTFDKVREAFRQFVENVPFYGFAVMCIDHPEVQALIGRIEDRRIITYGASPQADVRCADLRIENRPTRCSPRSSATGRPARRTPSRTCRSPCPASTMCRTPPAPSPSPTISASPTQAIAARPCRLRRRQAPLHADRHLERRRHHRRLRPPSGRDRRGAEGGARGGRRATSSPSSSRIASPASATSSTSSAPASTTPTR